LSSFEKPLTQDQGEQRERQQEEKRELQQEQSLEVRDLHKKHRQRRHELNLAHRTQQSESSAEQHPSVLKQKATPSAEETLFSGPQHIQQGPLLRWPPLLPGFSLPQTPSQGIGDPRDSAFWVSEPLRYAPPSI